MRAVGGRGDQFNISPPRASRNPFSPLDVNNNGTVSPQDAGAAVINDLESQDLGIGNTNKATRCAPLPRRQRR